MFSTHTSSVAGPSPAVGCLQTESKEVGGVVGRVVGGEVGGAVNGALGGGGGWGRGWGSGWGNGWDSEWVVGYQVMELFVRSL